MRGLCVAETFHLLEEALRSDAEIRTIISSESVYPTVERHVKGLKRGACGARAGCSFRRAVSHRIEPGCDDSGAASGLDARGSVPGHSRSCW